MSVATRALPSLTILLLAHAACSGDGGARSCSSDLECASTARCTAGTCVVNRPPVARLGSLAGPEAFAVVTLDGSASSDPDPGDAVSRFAWRISSIDAPCAAPVVAGTAATAQARFGCEGRFAVELIAFDELGAASSPAAVELEVLPSTAPPVLTVWPDVVVDHRCGGDPLVCTIDTANGRVPLGGSAPSPSPRLRWIVSPPLLPPGGSRRVTFDPSPEVLAPSVSIETDGAAIAGDWVFRLEAYDDLGVIGAGAMRVSVTNRAPRIEATMSPVPHEFNPATSRFTAGGEIAVLGYDQDGDPLDRQLSSRAVSTGPGTFAVVDLGDRITFSIQVPYSSPPDAAFLIGGATLERSISMVLRDPNGGEARETWPIVVENRPPGLAAAAPSVSVNHDFDSTAQAYRAAARLSRWSDPDGDPLFPDGPSGDVLCPDLTVDADGVSAVGCSLGYVGTPAVANFAGAHTIRVLARDPWVSAAAPTSTRLDILNSAPAAVAQTYRLPASCGVGSCCAGIPSSCDEYYTTYSAKTVHAVGFVTDLDGDPLRVDSAVASTTCEPAACELDVRMPAGQVCSPSGNGGGPAPYTATDGVATLSAAVSVIVECIL